MHVLVLGGTGYLGNKICKMLAESGNKVVTTVRSGEVRKNNNESFRMIPASMDAVEAAFAYEDFDMVINTVCNYGRSVVLYRDVIEANIEFPLRVLDMAVANDVKKFITIGTGLPDNLNMYSYSKKMFSEFGRFYVDKQHIDFINLKLEMFYGSDEPAGRFLPSIIRKMIRGEEVNVTLGTQKRDIIAVEDIMKAIAMVIDSDMCGYKEIAVGTGEGPTISDIVDYLWEISGEKSVVNKGAIPMRDNEPDSVADITEISSIGEWNPILWRDGLLNMYNTIQIQMKEDM